VAVSVVKAMVVLTGAIMMVRMQYRFLSRHNQACDKAVVASVCAVVARAVVTGSLHPKSHRWQRSQPRLHLVRILPLAQSVPHPDRVVIAASGSKNSKISAKKAAVPGAWHGR
jgi:hypothetical protein